MGDTFYCSGAGNPLASGGNHARREWFGTACCPSNIARLVASLGNYVYSTSDKGVWVNLYIGSEVSIPVQKQTLGLSMQTGYPWKGATTIAITQAPKQAIPLRLQIPDWLQEAAPGGLYYFEDKQATAMQVKVNDVIVGYQQEKGYAVIDRKWKKGDVVEVVTPMEVHRVLSRPELKQNNERVALQYGPMMYCVEDADNNGQAWNFIVPKGTDFVQYEPGLLGGVNTISFTGKAPVGSGDGEAIELTKETIKAIPYFSWNNRGAGGMQVWLPTAFEFSFFIGLYPYSFISVLQIDSLSRGYPKMFTS